MRPGLLITFEGGEGSGKTTQVARLADRLRASGQRVLTGREPGGTELGECVRAITRDPAVPIAELFLFEAARAQLISELVQPGLTAGAVVLLDRYTDSTLAYQGYGRGLELSQILQANAIATGGIVPDMTFLLDIDVERGLARKRGEIGHDAIGGEHREFHERVRGGYRALAAAEPQRWTVLDASEPPEVLEACIWETVQTLLTEVPADRLSLDFVR